MALFQEDWDEVIRVSEEFINLGGNRLYDLNHVDQETCGLPGSSGGTFWINQIAVDETVFLFSKNDNKFSIWLLIYFTRITLRVPYVMDRRRCVIEFDTRMGICVKKFILPGCSNWVELG